MTREEAIRNNYRGMADNEWLVYVPDADGNLYPVVYGTDAAGNPAMITEDTPWYNNLLLQGVNTAGSIFGGRGRNYGYAPAGATVQTQVSPSGVSTGFNLSNNTLLIGAAILAFFLLGKRGR